MDDTGREVEATGTSDSGFARRVPGYDDLERIGSGGSSTVYQAFEVRHQRPVAIKVLEQEASSTPSRTAFQREIEAIGRIGSHPYVVTILGSGFTADNHPYLVLPLFERGTYGKLIDEHGPLTWAAAVDVGIKLCSALETVHRAGVVHRDVKPGNVFIGVTPEHPLLADFGISSTVEGERTQTETMAVTFGYTAPEVLDDERPTPASDIYSLAMTIYRLIQGLHAYYAGTPAAVMRKMLSDPDRPQLSAGVPPAVAAVVADGLARDPAARPPSALALARRLQQVQVDQGFAPTPVVVADEEPVVDEGVPIDGASAAHHARVTPEAAGRRDLEAARVEASMVGAMQQQQPGIGGGDARGAADRVRNDRAGNRPNDRADVGRILAAAIRPADATDSAHSVEPTRHTEVRADAAADNPSLDLPTVVTPRKARPAPGEPPPEESTHSRRPRRPSTIALSVIGALVVVLIVGLALVAIG